jgi:DNA helicase-2/ATP-dependent DNA helicase PcrA
MSTTDGANFKFSWNNYRYPKEIQSHEKATFHNPAVLKLSSVDDSGTWREKILSFINKLMESGKLTDYNQIAFLFNSVKNPKVEALARFLEDNNINVHSPRSSMFFKRDEIKLAIGCLLLVFPNYVQKLENDEYDSRDSQYLVYYKNCITIAKSYLVQPKNKKLSDWITNKGKLHSQLKDNTELSYCDLLYQLFEFQPFSTILSTEVGVGTFNNRPSRNLAKLTQIIRKFECNYGVDTLNDTGCNEEASIAQNTEKLFNSYLSILKSRGINEHEDDSEYAPSGCVSFLTIHQAKGLEFPIVIIDSLDNVPRENTDPILVKIEQKYYKRPKFEPQENIKYFDFWRLYYTAFSRAQNLLILTCNEDGRTPSKYFKNSYADLQSVDSPDLDIDEFNFTPIKDVNIKPTYPLTSHIAIYETCPLQYKLYKELGFVPIRANNTLLGKLVHSTIEDIHRALLMDEKQSINRENVLSWFDSNYTALTKTYAAQLSDEQRNTALKQIFLYAAKQQDIDWSQLQQSGVKVSLVKPDYIILGKIDLLQGEDDTVEIVDFKYEQKPDMEKMEERLEQHIRQLHIYAHLVEENTGKKVSKIHLYYTEEKDEAPIVTYPYTKDSAESTLALLDDTVHKIMKKDFQKCTDNLDVCNECDFQFYCKGRYHLE